MPSKASPSRVLLTAGAHAAPHSPIAPASRARAEAASVRQSGAGAAAGAAMRARTPLGAHAAASAPGAGGGVRRRLAGGRCGAPGPPRALRSVHRTLMLHARELPPCNRHCAPEHGATKSHCVT